MRAERPPRVPGANRRAPLAKLCEARNTSVSDSGEMNPQPIIPAFADPLEQTAPEWAWHHRTLLALQQKALHAQAEHEKAAMSPVDKHALDPAESAQEESAHDVILAELHAEADRLREIDAALQRLRAGTYGVCEETGQPISPARLRAIPWTRYSRAAAERHERAATARR